MRVIFIQHVIGPQLVVSALGYHLKIHARFRCLYS